MEELERIVGESVEIKKSKFIGGVYVVEAQKSPERKPGKQLGIVASLILCLANLVSAADKIPTRTLIENDSGSDSTNITSTFDYKWFKGGIFRHDGKDYTSTTNAIWVPVKTGKESQVNFFGLDRRVNSEAKGISHDNHYKFIFQPSTESHFGFGWGNISGESIRHLGYDFVGKNSGFGIGFLDKDKDELRGYIWKYDPKSNLFIGAGKYNDVVRLVIGKPSDDGPAIRGMVKYNFETHKIGSMLDFTTNSRLLTMNWFRALTDDDLNHHSNSIGMAEMENPLNTGQRYVVPSVERLGYHGINGRMTFSQDNNFGAELLTYIGESPFWIGGKIDFNKSELARKAITGGINFDNKIGVRLEVYDKPHMDNIGVKVMLELCYAF